LFFNLKGKAKADLSFGLCSFEDIESKKVSPVSFVKYESYTFDENCWEDEEKIVFSFNNFFRFFLSREYHNNWQGVCYEAEGLN